MKTILMLVSSTEFYEQEYFIPRRTFVEEYGFEVDVASDSGQARGTQGTIIDVDVNTSDVDVSKYDAFFVVGGKGMIKFSKNKSAQSILKKFLRQKKPIAMICHGPLLATESGVARGRNITGWPDIAGKIRRAKGIWTGMPIERDGLLFTASGPDDAEDLSYVLSNFLQGKKTLPIRLPSKKEAQLWHTADEIEEEEDAAAKFLREHGEDPSQYEEPKPHEEEEARLIPVPEEKTKIEVEEVLIPSPKPHKEEEPIDIDELIAPKEKSIVEKQLEKLYKKPTEEEEKPTEEEERKKEELEKEMLVPITEEELEAPEEEKADKKETIFGIELKPPVDKKGKVLDRWMTEIEKPPMSEDAELYFAAENMKDGQSLTSLFDDEKVWNILFKEPHLLQKWILPHITLALAKRWFDINSQKISTGTKNFINVEDSPFGLFNERDYILLEQGEKIENLPSAKKYILMLNSLAAKYTNIYFSYGYKEIPNGKSLPIGNWVYKSLSRDMVSTVAREKGYKKMSKPVCSVCRTRKFNTSVTPKMEKIPNTTPILWKCLECYRQLEDIELKEVPELSANISHAKKKSERVSGNIMRAEVIIEDADDPIVKRRAEAKLKAAVDGYAECQSELAGFNSAMSELSEKKHVFENQLSVPYWHTWCPKENCPGQRIPLTAVDWNNEIWNTEDGKDIAKKLQNRFGIYSPVTTQSADDEGDSGKPEIPENIRTRNVPPDWMWDVPFICPHDSVKFTLRSALGKGYAEKGGFLWDPWRRSEWRREAEKTVELQDAMNIDTAKERSLDTKLAGAAFGYLADLAKMPFKEKYAELKKELDRYVSNELTTHKDVNVKIIMDMPMYQQYKRKIALFKAVKDLSEIDPMTFVSWLAEKGVVRKFTSDENGNIEEGSILQLSAKERKEDIYLPILQKWADKMLSEPDAIEKYGLSSLLVNEGSDGMPSDGPGTFFLTRISGDVLPREKRIDADFQDSGVYGFGCNLEFTKEKTRQYSAPNPKLLRITGIWKISPKTLETARSKGKLSESVLSGKDPVRATSVVHMLIGDDDTRTSSNRVAEMRSHDLHRAALDRSNTGFAPNEVVLVRALCMPGVPDPRAVKVVRELRSSADHKNIFANLGNILTGTGEDRDILNEFVKDVKDYKDDPKEMGMILEDLIEKFKKKEAVIKDESLKKAKETADNIPDDYWAQLFGNVK